jgi:hypothetical protein
MTCVFAAAAGFAASRAFLARVRTRERNMLGLDELETTADLTMGQAGQLVGGLARFADRGELARYLVAATLLWAALHLVFGWFR